MSLQKKSRKAKPLPPITVYRLIEDEQNLALVFKKIFTKITNKNE